MNLAFYKRLRNILFIVSAYVGLLGLSWYLAFEIRFDFTVPIEHQLQRLELIVHAIGIKLTALVLARQMGVVLTFFSIPDLYRMAWALAGSGVVMVFPRFLGLESYSAPRGVILLDAILAFLALCSLRLMLRMYRERIQAQKQGRSGPCEKIAIAGAGEAGANLAKYFLTIPARGFEPVVFLDDDSEKVGKRIHGILVGGKPEVLPDLELGESVSKVVIAMPSASTKRIREMALFFAQEGYKVEILPGQEEIVSGRARFTRTRPVEVQDLLGREEVEVDSVAIQAFVENKIVLVTGAGGSIGSELCRQIAARNPKRLLMVEQSEVSLFQIEQEMISSGLGSNAVPLICDILDEGRVEYIFERYQPDIVFHAAAHKHVYMMERQPMEAIKNNSKATRCLALIAAKYEIEAFVLISTDKAINPTNVMGASKRLAEIHLAAIQAQVKRNVEAEEAERLEAAAAAPAARRAEASKVPCTKFMAVRFGNVLGSSGSVVPIFRKQIEEGGPVTVTHPEVVRYFMTIPEAVGLVMQASVLGKGGEIFVLDMGQPVKIIDLAKQMIELSGYRVGEDIEIKFTGLKPGEKLYEEVRHKDESHVPTPHPRILRFVGTGCYESISHQAIEELEPHLHALDNNELKRLLKKLIPEYTPHWD